MATNPLGLALRAHEGFHTVTPYLVVDDAESAIDFYKQVFGAVEVSSPLKDPGSGQIIHAEIKIGNSPIMITDERATAQFGNRSAKAHGGSPIRLHIYVDDADRIVQQAVAAGAKELIPVGDQFYGARGGRIQDPFEHIWIVETQKEDWASVPHPEKQKRLAGLLKSATP